MNNSALQWHLVRSPTTCLVAKHFQYPDRNPMPPAPGSYQSAFCLWIHPFRLFLVNGIIQYGTWLLSLSSFEVHHILRLLLVAAHVSTSFLFMAGCPSVGWLDQFAYSFTCWWPFGLVPPSGCFEECCYGRALHVLVYFFSIPSKLIKYRSVVTNALHLRCSRLLQSWTNMDTLLLTKLHGLCLGSLFVPHSVDFDKTITVMYPAVQCPAG